MDKSFRFVVEAGEKGFSQITCFNKNNKVCGIFKDSKETSDASIVLEFLDMLSENGIKLDINIIK